jgi:hypothetical protein
MLDLELICLVIRTSVFRIRIRTVFRIRIRTGTGYPEIYPNADPYTIRIQA